MLANLLEGSTKESAIVISGVSKATASIQFAQWKKGNKTGQMPKASSGGTSGVPIPKEKDKKKKEKNK